MKRVLSSVIILAAAMVFGSCSDIIISIDEPQPCVEKTVLHITASGPATKTVFGDKSGSLYPTLWTTNKQVRFSANDTKSPVDVQPSGAGASASFSPAFSGLAESGTIYAFSPVGDYYSSPKVPGFTGFTTHTVDNVSNDAIYLNIPSEQTPLENSVDESAQAIVATQSYANTSAAIDMTFEHIVAYGKMTITNFTGTIKSVELIFPENVTGGSCKYLYKTGDLYNLNENSIVLDPLHVAGNVFWFALAPTAGTTGTMKIVITDEADNIYTKSIDLSKKNLPFNKGRVSAFTANFSGISADAAKSCQTFDLSTDSTKTASADSLTWVSSYAKMKVDRSTASTVANNYYPGTSGKSYTSTRFYKNSILTISPTDGYKIDSVVFKATSDDYAKALQSSTWTNATAECSVNSVIVRATDSTKQISATIGATCGFTSVRVYYSASSGGGAGGEDPAETTPSTYGGYKWLELPSAAGDADFVGCFYSSGTTGDAKNRNYTYNYDYDKYAALWVAYPLCKAHTEGSSSSSWKYNGAFSSSYQVNIVNNSYGTMYNASAYARGHQIPNADRQSNSTMNSQTYLATNQTPQIQNKFNGSIWSSLEKEIRNVTSSTDTLYVVTGAAFQKVGESETINYLTGASGKNANPSSLPIPNYYWKVLLKVERSGSTITSASAIGVWLPHQEYSSSDWSGYVISVDQIEQWTGFDFFVNLPDSLESSAEANTSWSSFSSF